MVFGCFGVLFVGDSESSEGTCFDVSAFPWRAWGSIGHQKRFQNDAALFGQTKGVFSNSQGATFFGKKAKRHSFRYIGCFALRLAVFEQHSHRHGAKRRGPQREYQNCLEVCLEVRLSQMVDTVTKVNETGETT